VGPGRRGRADPAVAGAVALLPTLAGRGSGPVATVAGRAGGILAAAAGRAARAARPVVATGAFVVPAAAARTSGSARAAGTAGPRPGCAAGMIGASAAAAGSHAPFDR